MSELKHTVEISPNIFEVHFDAQGNHYFNVWQHSGALFGKLYDGIPVISSKITETKTREEVLGKSRNFDTTDKRDFVEKQIKKSKK